MSAEERLDLTIDNLSTRDIRRALEPAADNDSLNTVQAAGVSTAISLKRIADALTIGGKNGPNFADVPWLLDKLLSR